MDIDILINQVDEHNQGSIVAVNKFKPKKVIYIRSKEEEEAIKSLKSYYQNYMPNIIFREEIIEEGKIQDIIKLINKNMDKNVLINLTGGKRINSLILLKVCNDKGLDSIYVDIKEKNLYRIGKDTDIIHEEFEDLEIEDIVKASGGEILEDSTGLCKKEDLVYLTKQIYKNLPVWHKHKQKLYNTNIFVHDYNNSNIVTVKIEKLSNEEMKLLEKILSKLEELKGIEYKKLNNNEIEVVFLNNYLKGFIFKSGTWLELATNIMINELKEIDEVKSGLMFLWNNNVKVVRNEVDVVAIKDCIPICISCKDSSKYNEVALNELDVYANQIGGKKIYKILVATKEPIKTSVRERAKEMGISLVIFDGDENRFKMQIQSILKK